MTNRGWDEEIKFHVDQGKFEDVKTIKHVVFDSLRWCRFDVVVGKG